MSKITVSEHMTQFPDFVEPNATVREALYKMGEKKFRHLPVVDCGNLVGVVSEKDLRTCFAENADMFVSQAMTPGAYCVNAGTPLEQVLETMEVKKLGSVVVVTEKNSVLGIFTTTDALRLLRQLVKDEKPAQISKNAIEKFLEDWVHWTTVGALELGVRT